MTRKHAAWSASATERNLYCAGSLALIAAVPPAPESRAAAWGTAMHAVIEKSLLNGTEPIELIGTVEKTESFEIVVDEEMVDAAKVSTDYCRSLIGEDSQYWIEDEFSLAAINPPMEAGGTGDFVAWNPGIRTIEVVDHKGGRGRIVEVQANAQLLSYGLGVLLKHPGLPAEWIKLTIIQPRAEHPDGVIRSETLCTADLVDWASELITGMRRSQQALTALREAGKDRPLLDTWRDTWLRPGKCIFCAAAGQCPALRRDAMAMVDLYFDDFGAPTIHAEVADNLPEVVEKDLEAIEALEAWIGSRRAYAHQLAEGGHQFKDWTLVERIGHRRWNDAAEHEAAEKIAAATGLSTLECFTRKSPAQIEKAIGASRKKVIEPLWSVPVIGRDLVRKSKAMSRRPAMPLVETFFDVEKETEK